MNTSNKGFEEWWENETRDVKMGYFKKAVAKAAWDSAIDEAVQILELMIFNSNNEYREEALDGAAELIKELKQ